MILVVERNEILHNGGKTAKFDGSDGSLAYICY